MVIDHVKRECGDVVLFCPHLVLGIKPRALRVPGKGSATELDP